MAAMILEGSYRDIAAASAEVFHLAYVMVLGEYPDDCIRSVTDPRSGIQSFGYAVFDHTGREVKGKFKSFPPNPGELQEACEKYMAPIRAGEERERRQAAQLEESKREAGRLAMQPARADVEKILGRAIGSTVEVANLIGEAGRKIGGAIEQRERSLRVQMDIEERRARRLALYEGGKP